MYRQYIWFCYMNRNRSNQIKNFTTINYSHRYINFAIVGCQNQLGKNRCWMILSCILTSMLDNYWLIIVWMLGKCWMPILDVSKSLHNYYQYIDVCYLIIDKGSLIIISIMAKYCKCVHNISSQYWKAMLSQSLDNVVHINKC